MSSTGKCAINMMKEFIYIFKLNCIAIFQAQKHSLLILICLMNVQFSGQGFAERRKKKVLQQYKKVSTKDDKTTKLMKEKLKQIYEMDSAEVKEEEKGYSVIYS